MVTLERTAHSPRNIRQMLFILIIFFVLSGFANAEAVGKTTEGSSSDYWALRMVSTLFQSSLNGSACNITALMDVGAGDSPRMRFFVYAQNQSLLASSLQYNFSSSAYSKNNFTRNLTSCITVYAGSWYWLGWTADANIRYYFDDVAGVNSSIYYRYYDGALPDPSDFYSSAATQNSTIWLDVSSDTTTTSTTTTSSTTSTTTTSTTTSSTTIPSTTTTTTSTSTTSTTVSPTTTTSTSSGSSTTLGCCAVNIMSSAGEPVQYATATIRNITSGVLYGTNSSDSSGNVYWNVSCEDLNWTIVYPTSSYSAVLGNMSVQSEVHINDYVTARVQILNTLGSMLEGQDASVSVYDANGSLIHDFRTLCQSKPEIVCQGSVCNYASVSDCEFSDSRGWYYFKGKVLESDGFEYGTNYTLRIIANGQMAESNFTTVLERQPDTNKLEAFINQYGGMIVLGILGAGIILVFAVIVVSLLSWAWHKGRKKK